MKAQLSIFFFKISSYALHTLPSVVDIFHLHKNMKQSEGGDAGGRKGKGQMDAANFVRSTFAVVASVGF